MVRHTDPLCDVNRQIALTGTLWYHSTSRQPFFNYCAHEGNKIAQHIVNVHTGNLPTFKTC